VRTDASLTRRLQRVLEAGSACALLVLMFVVLVDVVGRNLFNRPLPWGTELLEIVLALMIFLLYPVLGLRSGHITVDLIEVPPWVQRVQRVLGGAIGATVFGLIAWCMGKQAIRAAGYGEATALLNIPLSLVIGGMSVMGIVTSAAFLASALQLGRAMPHDLTREAI